MNLYIGNLSYNVKESDFAFIEMPDDTEANNAIKQLNGAEYVGRSMVVKEALPRN